MTTREAFRSAVAEIVDEVMEARDADGVEPSGEEVAVRVLRAVVETLGVGKGKPPALRIAAAELEEEGFEALPDDLRAVAAALSALLDSVEDR